MGQRQTNLPGTELNLQRLDCLSPCFTFFPGYGMMTLLDFRGDVMRFKDLLRFRSVWLGVAMLWILFYHMPIDLTGPVDFVRELGYAGVDICLFASGIGCFFSLSSDADIGRFMKRRMKRLAPAYLIFLIFWLAYQIPLGQFGWRMALGNILGIQYFARQDNAFNWYISAILLFYLLAPYMKTIIDRSSPLGRIAALGVLVLGTVPFWNCNTLLIIVARLPLFFVGMLCGKLCQTDKKISAVHIILSAAAFLVGTAALMISYLWLPEHLWSKALYWYPFILMTPPLCMAISYLAALLEKNKFTKPIVSFLSVCGDYSFELYLMHIMVITLLSILVAKYNLYRYSYPIWAAGGVALALGCYLLRAASKLCLKLLSKLSKTPSVT